MNRALILFFISCSLLVAASAQDTRSVHSALAEIESLYNTGQYLAAEVEARRLSELLQLSDSVKIQIEKWIAFSLIAQEKTVLARARFIALLSIDPNFQLDLVLTSPKILTVFNDAKVRFFSQQRLFPDTAKTMIVRHSGESITFRSAVFPGWEQLHQGRTTLGYLFLSAGAASLGSGLAFELLRANAREEYLNATVPSDIATKYDTYNTYRKAEIYSFIAFAAIYLASEIDVFTQLPQQTFSFQPTYSGQSGTALTLTVRF